MTYKITFTYQPDSELGPQPEDVSVHEGLELQSARNLASYNMDNKGLVSILIEIESEQDESDSYRSEYMNGGQW